MVMILNTIVMMRRRLSLGRLKDLACKVHLSDVAR
jgi:hypothetical protein